MTLKTTGVAVALALLLVVPGAAHAGPYGKSPKPPVDASGRTLYERLGGEHGLWVVVNDFFNRLQQDGDMRGTFIGVDVPQLKHHVVDYLSGVTGGPDNYHGRDMRSAHARMKISPEDWDNTMRDLHETLVTCKVPAQEQKELTALVSDLREQIVQAEDHDSRGGDPGQF